MTNIVTIESGPRRVTRQVIVDAPVEEVFALINDPHRHGELDGSGTVKDTVEGPKTLSSGAKFSVKMKQYGIPYKITSTVIDYAQNQVIAWRHPLGHSWRWEFATVSPGQTRVTETFDFHDAKSPKMVELFGFPKKNAAGITATLEQLARRFGAS